MQILTLIFEDGSGGRTNYARGLLGVEGFIHAIRTGKVETIVVGEVNEAGEVLWEKQFSEVTVLPSSFGKPS